MKIQGRIALITGASSGIGAATAEAMAGRGARVVLLARTAPALADLAAAIKDRGGQAHAYPVDLSDAAAVAAVADRISAEVGVPDIIVNNAGAGRFLALAETSPEEAVAMMAAPYFAAVFVTRAFLPAMLARRSGHLVNVTSPAGLIAFPGMTGYAAARWAMRGFNEALRAELHGTGIGVTLVVPGEVRSSYFANNPGSQERIPRISRLARPLSPAQVAEALIRGVERNQRSVMTPWLVRCFYILHNVLPWPVEWLVRATGWKHPR